MRRLSSLILGVLVSGSCGQSDSEQPTEQYTAQATTTNGGTWNGGTWNGGTWNGGTWNGGTWNGGKINSLTITVEGSLLKGLIQPGNKVVSGRDFIGSVYKVTHIISKKEQEEITFRIDDVYLDADSPFRDIWRYRVSYKSSKDNIWQSLCLTPSGQPTDLIPLVGMYWDFITGARYDQPSSFTYACKGGAIEKSVNFGYRPWASALQCKFSSNYQWSCDQVSLKNHLQASIRMLRADYCGDGRSWTNEKYLDIYDYLLPQIQSREYNWDLEARWTQDGATCLNMQRHPELGFSGSCTEKGVTTPLPKCPQWDFSGGLLVSTFDVDGKWFY